MATKKRDTKYIALPDGRVWSTHGSGRYLAQRVQPAAKGCGGGYVLEGIGCAA